MKLDVRVWIHCTSLALGAALLLALLVTTSRSEAYPWKIRHGYGGCTPCHADPSGGGLLTAYGRAMEATVLRANYGKASELEEPSHAGFLWGAVELPESLLATVSYRGLYLGTETPSDRGWDWRYVQMTTDVRAQATIGSVRINGSVGFVREGARAAAITSGESNNLVSREHWLGYELDGEGEWLVRAGRINLPFGIRTVEHTFFVRTATRTSINADQQHGASVSYTSSGLRGELMGVAGNFQLGPDEFRARGYSGLFEMSVGEDVALGGSSLMTYARRDQELRVASLRHAHGVFVRASFWHPLVLLAEMDVVVRAPKGAPGQLGYATLVQADLEVVQGVHAMVTGETHDAGEGGTEPSWAGWLTVDYFFLPHAEFRVDGIRQRRSLGPASVTSNALMAQLHFYL